MGIIPAIATLANPGTFGARPKTLKSGRSFMKATKGCFRPIADICSLPAKSSNGRAWIDGQYGVSFHNGFEMFRRFKGRDYLAQVADGQWEINRQKVVAKSINEVSKAIGAERENGWAGWNFRTQTGEVKKISEMRDPERIIRRSSSSRLSKDVLDRLNIRL